jgi:MFS family permease
MPLSLVYGIFSWGWGLTTPIFAILINSITKDIFLTGIIISIWGVIGLISDIPSGILCDKFSLKRILQFCLFFYIFITIGYALATNFWELLVVRIAHSAFGALMWVAIWAYLFKAIKKDHTGEEIGIFSMFYDFAATVAPIIGGIIATISFFMPFYILSVCCGISLLIISFMLKDYPPCQRKPFFFLLKKELGDFKKVGMSSIGKFAFLIIVVYSAVNIISVFLPILLHEAGVSYSYIGVVIAVAILPAVLMEAFLGKYVDHKQHENIIVIGLLGLGLSVIPLIFTLHIGFVLFTILFYGITSSLIIILINAIAFAMAPRNERGAFSGITTFFKDIGNFAGPLIGGFALKFAGTPWTMSLVAFICVISAGIFYFIKGNKSASAKIL